MPLAILWSIFAALGVITFILGLTMPRSVNRSDVLGFSILIAVVCGLFAAATYASFTE